jgi:signal transduction histidine kinase
MSLRLRIFGEGFGRRLLASLGVGEAFRVENWLCATRVVLALYCFAWIQMGTAKLGPQPLRVQALLDMYLLYSLLIFVLLSLHGAADGTYRLTTLAVDLFFAGTVTLFTGGPESPYGVLWVFVVMTAAYRWGLRETNLTAALCTLFLLVEVEMFRLWPRYFEDLGETDFRMDRLLSRSIFLVVAGLLLGYLAVRERRLHAESALVARVLRDAQVGARMDLALESLFAELAPLYTPRKALVALRRGNVEEVFSWESDRIPNKPHVGMVRTVLQFSQLEAAAFSFPAHTWYFNQSLGHWGTAPHLLALDVIGRRVGSLHSDDLQSCLSATEIPSLMVSSFSFEEPWHGRLILVGAPFRTDSKDALRFLQSLVKRVGPVVKNICLLQDIRTQVEDQVRAGLTRELHDGTLPSLLSAEMQIEVLRRQRSDLTGELKWRRLAALQALIHKEALNLRDLIEKTKPLNFSPKELPDFLAELVARFRRDTGISVRLETGEENITLPPGICHEIVRIVQEGLSNVRKHSGASNVVITLCEGDEGQHKLLIADDGEGFGFRGRVTQTQLDASHRGPGVIKERVRLIGGELTIDSTPGHGARLEITIPDESHG